MQKSDLEKRPLSIYYHYLKTGREPYISIWEAVVDDVVSFSKREEIPQNMIYFLDTDSIEKRLKMAIADREANKKVTPYSINRTVAAGLLGSGLKEVKEGEVIIKDPGDFFTSRSCTKKKYHLKINEENVLKLQEAFK
jgi:hypothetical protein